jgi:hypothetical protein
MPGKRGDGSIATELAMDVKGEAATLQQHLAELENRKLALQRLSSFVSIHGAELQCPRCWILNDAAASLRPIDGGKKDQDSFQCTVCESEFGLRI